MSPDYYPDFALALYNKKRCFFSKHGLYGLALPGIAVGGLIVIFPGLAVPLILREVKDRGYRIISDAYVKGIMNKETKHDVGPDGF